MITAQKLLPFETRLKPERKQLVSLSDLDSAYRQRCIDEDLDLPDYMLLDTRCQRIGMSKSEFTHMPKLEQNRQLSDEACVMRYSDWEYAQPGFIDWQRVNCEAKAVAHAFQNGLAKFVAQSLSVPVVENKRRK
jgi:hypothetical protein